MHSLAFIVVLSISSISFGQAVVRRSSDGVEYPQAAKELFRTTALPFVQNRLGGLPEEMGGKVINSVQSKETLSKLALGTDFDCAWLLQSFAGAKACGFDLTDGRVTRIVLIYAKPLPSRGSELSKRLSQMVKSKDDNLYTAKNLSGGASLPFVAVAGSMQMEFKIDPVEWSLLYHSTTGAIASGMRSKTPVEGMSVEQALATFGTPEAEDTLPQGITNLQWTERKPAEPRHAAAGSVRDQYIATVGADVGKGEGYEAKKPNKGAPTRTVVIQFKKDVAVEISVQTYK